MPVTFEDKLVVAISSRALFDLEEGHRVFVEQGVDAYCRYQIERENEKLEPGVAFAMVQKLLNLQKDSESLVEVVLISRNSADTGLRVFNSIQHYDLNITRAAFSGGNSPYRYIKPFQAHLFLSAEPDDVNNALSEGLAAATILPSRVEERADGQLRIAFDGDAVVFSDVAEQVYQREGLAAFAKSERDAANSPLPGGPFKNVLAALHRIQSIFPADEAPIRTALFTARAAPAHERVVRTLRAWDIRIDEVAFLGGVEKGKFLKTFGADIFFDDQQGHCDSTRQYVATGHVPSGLVDGLADGLKESKNTA